MLCFLLVHDVVSLFDNVVDAQILVICRDFYDTKAESFRIWLGLYMFKCGLHIGEAFFCLSSGPAFHNQTEFISADTGENIFFSESLHSTLRFGRRKTIVSQTMCALAEHLSQSEIELPLRNTCYYSPLAEVGVSTQTEINQPLFHFVRQGLLIYKDA